MAVYLLYLIILLSFGLFFVPKRFQHPFTLLLQIALIGLTGFWAIQSFQEADTLKYPFITLLNSAVYLTVDKLSAFFIFVINFTCLTGIIYAKGYLKPYTDKKGKTELALHYFNFFYLHLSMLLVVMVRDGLAFLIIWEIMSLSSFFLVIFESEKKETLKIGINYLIQMHVGVVFLMLAFLWAFVQTGAPFSFDGLALYFEAHNPFLLFFLFFVGFGIKAGFIPLHSWLPHAHPAAPSHVSGVMSGVMIKMGIYGILRILTYIHHELFYIGIFILIISLISGILGVSLAIVQHDIKKLLAYHSIENIGIIGIGIGLGTIGLSENIPLLSVLGFGGGILHILNHSLFKSLLFYTAGSVYQQTHTRNIEQLGGLIKRMPKTAWLFLIGALAISGLPPFNGFISEFLIYSGMFKSLHGAGLTTDIVILFSFSGLAIIGGLAIFCFTKVFSIIFLGNARSDKVKHASEVKGSMLLPKFLIAFFILLIGLVPVIVIHPLSNIVDQFTGETMLTQNVLPALNNISLSAVIFLALIALLWMIRSIQQKKKVISQGATWGCGYTGANPALHQYTATSYADNFVQLSSKVVDVKKEFSEFEPEEIFPADREFKTHSGDIFEKNLISNPTNKILQWLKRIAVFQTGKIQHYLLYAIAFVAIIFLLTYLNWI